MPETEAVKKKVPLALKILLTMLCLLLLLGIVFVFLRMRGQQELKETVLQDSFSVADLGKTIMESNSGLLISANDANEANEENSLKEGEILYKGKKYAYNRDLICILVMGIDKKGEFTEAKDALDGGQADALFLILLNPHKSEYAILGINRNTMAEVDVFDREGNYQGSRLEQIALQHGYGDGREESCLRQIKTVSRFMHNIPVHAYVALNVAAVGELNDAVGGVSVTPDEDIRIDGVTYPAGVEVSLTGKQASYYVMHRDFYVFDSNSQRQQRQKQYLQAFVEKTKGILKEKPGMAVTLYQCVEPYMVTDIDVSQVSYLATEYTGYHMCEEGIRSIPGEVRQGEVFEEFYADDEAVKDLIVELFYEAADGN